MYLSSRVSMIEWELIVHLTWQALLNSLGTDWCLPWTDARACPNYSSSSFLTSLKFFCPPFLYPSCDLQVFKSSFMKNSKRQAQAMLDGSVLEQNGSCGPGWASSLPEYTLGTRVPKCPPLTYWHRTLGDWGFGIYFLKAWCDCCAHSWAGNQLIWKSCFKRYTWV